MKKNFIFVFICLGLAFVFGPGCSHKTPHKGHATKEIPADAEELARLSMEAEKKTAPLFERIQADVKKKDYDHALELTDKIIDEYGPVPILESASYSTYREMMEAERERIRCLKRRSPEKTFDSVAELRKVTLTALKEGDSDKLATLFHCGVGWGAPASEYDFIYKPEDVAKKLIVLRKDPTANKLLPLSELEGKGISTEGYWDGRTRRFEPAQELQEKKGKKTPKPRWYIKTILEGEKEEVLEAP